MQLNIVIDFKIQKKIKIKNYIIISVDTGKALSKILYLFLIFKKLLERNILNLIKNIYSKPIANIILGGDN